MHSVGADFEIVVLTGSLVRDPPVERYASDVETAARAVIGLRCAKVLRAIKRAPHIKMIVPHSVAAETGHVLQALH